MILHTRTILDCQEFSRSALVWDTDTVLRSTFRGWVTTMWVNRPLKISQLDQLSLSSFRGR